MRAVQMGTSRFGGWHTLSAAYPRLRAKREIGGGVLAELYLPGHTERFRDPYPASRHYRRR